MVMLPTAGLAIPEIPEEEGLSGFFGIGGGKAEIDSNTIVGNSFADVGQKESIGIAQSTPTTDESFPAFIGEARWTFASGNQVFAGTSVEDQLTLDGGVAIGWRTQVEDMGTFEVAGLNSTIQQEVWADPYLAGTREKTDRDAVGLRLGWDRIMGTNFEVQLNAREIDVDDEESGSDFAPGVMELLDRDGDELSFKASYLFDLGGGHLLRPQVIARSFDADGDAVAYDSARLQLTYSWSGDRTTFITSISTGEMDYDDPNPLFGDKQDSDTFEFDASVLYTLPIDDDRWQLGGNIFWGEIDSDIDFHDSDGYRIVATLIYRFGNLGD